jgi:pyochelin synthetase
MTVAELVRELESVGVRLWEESGQLKFRAPRGVMTPDRKDTLRESKDAVLEHLRRMAETTSVVPQPQARHEPFPLSDLQSAYLMGRRESFAWGGVGSHIYAEIAFADLEPDRLAAAWHQLVRRHDMLRAVVDPSGSQQVLPEVEPPPIPVDDLRGHSEDQVDAAIAATRAAMEHHTYDPAQWPLFDLRCSRLADDQLRLHLSIDFLVADFSSIQRLLLDINQLCYEPGTPLPELELSYRDYLIGMRALRESARYERDQAYWWSRLDGFPAAPELPAARGRPETGGKATFRRHSLPLTDADWDGLRARAATAGLTLSVATMAAFAEVVGRWSANPRFALNLTLFNRQPLHPQVDQLVGDFTALSMLEVDSSPTASFADRARTLQARLWQDMDHRACSGIDVLRELTRRGTGSALMPIVFTSTIGLNEVGTGALQREGKGRFVHGVTQTPQVWLDCQVTELDTGLVVNWDVRDGVFPDGMIEDMATAMADLLRLLASTDDAWEVRSPVVLPATQTERHDALNRTTGDVPDELLHEGALAQALRTPDRTAVTTSRRTLTYGELFGRALAVAEQLADAGPVVAVVMDKGWEQIVAAYGVLLSGRAYLPVDTHQPPSRRERILADAGTRVVLTQSWLSTEDTWPAGARLLAVDEQPCHDLPDTLPERKAGPEDIAYVIYTSGSTGMPKGVMVSHRSAVNTVAEINRRFGIEAGDSVLGMALLGFDLSVYDTFGPLAAGGGLVLPDAGRRADPSHWAAMIARHGVTFLNTVPAQLHMLHTYLESAADVELPSLRMAFMSGDRIPVALPDRVRGRLPHVALVSLGGPTETTIWSIFHPIGEVGADRTSIPYGRPLANHTHHVLDTWLRPCPDWVAGELYGGGLGVAIGYLNDEQRTAERFLTYPPTGERIYRTGDVGRRLPDGDIEILGRADDEVKIRGHRVALVEVEAALLGHPDVAAACAVVNGDDPVDRRLVAFVASGRREGDLAPGPDGAALASAVDVAAKIVADQDSRRYAEVAARLEAVALRLMVDTLRGAGLFADSATEHTLTDVLTYAEVADRHVRVIRRWLAALVREGYLVADGDAYRLADPAPAGVGDPWQELASLKAQVPSERPLVEYFETSARVLPEVIAGRSDPMQLLYPQGSVENAEAVFRDNFVSRAANGLLAESLVELAQPDRRPGPLRVLEVGAGHWGATGELLTRLDGLEADYLFTDVSEFFVTTAQNTFGTYDWVRYGVFDLNRHYREQGLSANAFDVIVCPNVLHYARDADAAVGRLRELLAPGGWLVFTDTVRDTYHVLASVEFLFRFGEGETDFADAREGRDQTFLTAPQWTDVLTGVGAEEVLVHPAEDHVLSELGVRLFAARFKSDRVVPSPSALRSHLVGQVPEHMVPAAIEVVDELPATANGKVDRELLGSWVPQRRGGTVAGRGTAPLDDLERSLAEVWGELLNAPGVGRDDNFFELGGDSLLAARLAGDITERVPEAGGLFFEDLLGQMLASPTVAELAEFIRRSGTGGQATDHDTDESGALLLAEAPDDDLPLVLVHDLSGAFEHFDPLLGALADRRTVYALAPDRSPAWLAVEPAALIEALAGQYVDLLLAEGRPAAHVVGEGHTAPLAVEVARQLGEAGVDVPRLTLVDPAEPAGLTVMEWFNGTEMPAERAVAFAERMLAACSQYEPQLYSGDIELVVAADQTVDVWRDNCLGEVAVSERTDVESLAVTLMDGAGHE